ncbi:leucine-rich repeat-containing protein 72 isoform X3 [Apus apus]|uniref:leucine-rich repeat-containing protein 72 isoform X3 n=1 Tax=Apus apus TaxID=8895 RepID=UPI0021F8E261|nr:leucine-rich repeat-containing protein 72 isoform X3 [Apus apus]
MAAPPVTERGARAAPAVSRGSVPSRQQDANMAAAAGSAAGQAVEKQLKICGFKRNMDVLVLYLAGQGLRSIPGLSRFRRLRYLWINNNKIQDLTFLKKNYCLTELYLNNNELTDITGALKHLCSLQILLLHNNQLGKLGRTVKELKGITSLQTLTVTQRERESALHFYDHKKSSVIHSIAFGKKVNIPLGYTVGSSRCSQLARRLVMPSGCEFENRTNKVPFENPEDAILVRAVTRSLMEFSCLDWNKVATCQERRLESKAEKPHEKLTVQFR